MINREIIDIKTHKLNLKRKYRTFALFSANTLLKQQSLHTLCILSD